MAVIINEQRSAGVTKTVKTVTTNLNSSSRVVVVSGVNKETVKADSAKVYAPPGRGVESITNSDVDSIAVITYTDGTTSSLNLPTVPAGEGTSAVQSVNGQIGNVVITADDVGALPDNYVPQWEEIVGTPTEFLPSEHQHDISDVAGLQDALNSTVQVGTTVSLDSSGTPFLRVDIPASDGTPTNTWPDRLAFYFDGTRSGYFNEYGELRARPSQPTTVGFRSMSHWNAAPGQEYFQVSENGNYAAFGVSKELATTRIAEEVVHDDPTKAKNSTWKRIMLNYSLSSPSLPDMVSVVINGVRASWQNEWGALRGTSPWSWGDALIRGIRQDGDGMGSNSGNYAELVDERTGRQSTVMHGRRWSDGALVRNDNVMADVYVIPNGGTIPTNLPDGTVIVELDQ